MIVYIANMGSYMQVLSPHMWRRNAESRFKKILLMALFGFRCFQNDLGRIFRQQSISSAITIKVSVVDAAVLSFG